MQFRAEYWNTAHSLYKVEILISDLSTKCSYTAIQIRLIVQGNTIIWCSENKYKKDNYLSKRVSL